MSRCGASRAGFTLIELLAAILVFGIMSAMAYGGLNAVLRTRDQATDELQRLAAVQRTVTRLERDIAQIAQRPVRDQFGDRLPAVIANPRNAYPIELTRRGWRNPLDRARSTMQRVAYRIEDRHLVRYYWQTLDRPQQDEPLRSELLERVTDIDLRFMDAGREWHGQWPPITGVAAGAGGANAATGDTPTPAAVEVTLELADWGRIRRLINVAGGS